LAYLLSRYYFCSALVEVISERSILYNPVVIDACCGLFREKGFKLEEQAMLWPFGLY